MHILPAGALLALAALNVSGADITGSVADNQGEPVINATLRLLRPDSTFIRGKVTDFDGRFSFADVNPGRYILQADYTGFAPYDTDIRVDSASQKIDLGKIGLTEKSLMLSQVEVVAVKTQVKVKGDTVEYNADSYQTRPNAVVEDLIKRLPGVEVSSDGKITAHGREVSKILLDGKEFFGDDPTVASKNLPVDIVDKLQIVERKSDQARLTGVDDGEDETVINLSIKKGKNNGWTGNVEGGYGTDSRYKGAFTVNRFWEGNQFTLLGNANNINDIGFNDGGARWRRRSDDNGISESQSLGFNFNVGNKEILRVGGNVFYSHADRNSTEFTDRQYLTDGGVSAARIGSRNHDNTHNFRADFRILWKPDTLNTLEVRPRISYGRQNSAVMDSTLNLGEAFAPLSRNFNDNTEHNNNFDVGARVIYSHSFASKRGRSLSVTANVNHSNQRSHSDDYSLTRLFLEEAASATGIDEDETSDQLGNDHEWTDRLSGRITWTEPIGRKGNFLTAAYQAEYRWNNADRLTDVYDSETGLYYPSDKLSNRFRNNYFNQDIRLGFKRITPKYTVDAGLSLVPQSSTSVNLLDDARSIPTRHVLNVAPYLRYRHNWSKTRSLRVNYFGRSSQPSMTQLQPVADESDPMNVIVGNPTLDPSFTHGMRMRFQDYNAEAQRSILVMLMGNVVQNSVVSRTSFDDVTGARRTTYENVNGVWNLRLMNMLSQPLGSSKMWLMTSHVMLSYDRQIGFNNGLRNGSGTFRLNISPSIAWRPKDIDLELRPRYSLQHTVNSLPTVGNMTLHTYGANFNASWYTPWGIVLNSELSYEGTKGYTSGFDENVWMWNASIGYQFLRNKAATLTLKGYDILGQRSNVQRNVTANYIDDSRFNTLTRYVMVTLAYTFNSFGKGNEPKTDNSFRHGPMGPPPGHGRP